MESKKLKIAIIVAIIVGVVAIIAIPTLIFITSKPSETVENNLSIENKKQEENEEDTTDFLDDLEDSSVKSFNEKFIEYEGDSVSGANINALLQAIINNNEQNEEHKIRAMADVQNWDYDNNKADTQSNYKVSCEKDDEGYINVIKIEDSDF